MNTLNDIEKKEAKRLYDIEYRKKNRKKIKAHKKAYCESEAGRSMQKRQREKQKLNGYTNTFNSQPEQREKERHRRYVRQFGADWVNNTKECLICKENKYILDFEWFDVFPDKRNYLCKECESEQKNRYGCSTRGVMTAMVMRPYTSLTRVDIAKCPELIEANKFLILLKQELL